VRCDDHEYEQLIAPIEAQMMRVIWRIVRNADDAEDALQDALTVVWKRFDRIQRHPSPQALILRICLDAAVDLLRKRLKQQRREVSHALDGAWSDPGPSPADCARANEQRDRVVQAISRLPRNQARAVLLRIVEEQPYRAIAEALGCREATARAHVRRGRAQLVQLLEPLFPHAAREVTQP
jgi:RNA polymerase sigma-70 factor (ECF subfamily)